MDYSRLIQQLDEWASELFVQKEYWKAEVLDSAARIIYQLSQEKKAEHSPA